MKLVPAFLLARSTFDIPESSALGASSIDDISERSDIEISPAAPSFSAVEVDPVFLSTV